MCIDFSFEQGHGVSDHNACVLTRTKEQVFQTLMMGRVEKTQKSLLVQFFTFYAVSVSFRKA